MRKGSQVLGRPRMGCAQGAGVQVHGGEGGRQALKARMRQDYRRPGSR